MTTIILIVIEKVLDQSNNHRAKHSLESKLRFPKSWGYPQLSSLVGLPMMNHPALGYPHSEDHLAAGRAFRQVTLESWATKTGATCEGAKEINLELGSFHPTEIRILAANSEGLLLAIGCLTVPSMEH